MQVRMIGAAEKEFTNKAGEKVQGFNLVFLNEQTGETFRYFVGKTDLKGFSPKQLCKISGPELDISTTAKTWDGKTRVVLDSINELE